MRRLLLSLFLFAGSLPAAISLVAHTAAGSSGAFTVTTPAINTTGANLIVVYIAHDGSTGGPSDSAGNTFTCLTNYHPSFPNLAMLCYVLNPVTSASHTFSYSSGGSAPSLAVEAFSGVASFGTQNGNAVGSGTTIQTGSVTPSVASSLVISGLATNAVVSVSIDSSFTITDTVTFLAGNHYAISMAYLITGSAVNPTWTISSSNWMGASIATFAPTGGVSAFVPQVGAFLTGP